MRTILTLFIFGIVISTSIVAPALNTDEEPKDFAVAETPNRRVPQPFLASRSFWEKPSSGTEDLKVLTAIQSVDEKMLQFGDLVTQLDKSAKDHLSQSMQDSTRQLSEIIEELKISVQNVQLEVESKELSPTFMNLIGTISDNQNKIIESLRTLLTTVNDGQVSKIELEKAVNAINMQVLECRQTANNEAKEANKLKQEAVKSLQDMRIENVQLTEKMHTLTEEIHSLKEAISTLKDVVGDIQVKSSCCFFLNAIKSWWKKQNG